MVRDIRPRDSATSTIEFKRHERLANGSCEDASAAGMMLPTWPRPSRAVELGGANDRSNGVSAQEAAHHLPAVLPSDTVRALTEAVAQELHRRYGGNHVLDWLEAEMLVKSVLDPSE